MANTNIQIKVGEVRYNVTVVEDGKRKWKPGDGPKGPMHYKASIELGRSAPQQTAVGTSRGNAIDKLAVLVQGEVIWPDPETKTQAYRT